MIYIILLTQLLHLHSLDNKYIGVTKMSLLCNLNGLLLVICIFTLAKSQVLTLVPRTAEAGNDVEIHCAYLVTKGTYIVVIEYKDTTILEFKSATGNIAIGADYEHRIQHTPQSSYNNSVKIALNNVTRDDDGRYMCGVSVARLSPITDVQYLTVYVPPRSLRVFVASPPPYKESRSSNPYRYTVKCTFSVYPNIRHDLWPFTITHRNVTHQPSWSSRENGAVYDVTLSTNLQLTREDNGQKSVSCNVTWRRDTDREKTYTAQLETPLNVTFATADITMDILPKTTFTAGETLSVTCRSGSANPPQHINWRIHDYITEGIEVTHEPGEFNGQKTVSTLRVTAERWMDGEEVTCCHSVEDANHCKASTLNVTYLPRVEEDSLLISLNADTITLSWETPSGEYDTMTIQQCEKVTGKCTEHVATGLRGLLLTVGQDVEYEFFLVLYRADQVVVKAGPFVEKQDTNLQLKAASKTVAPILDSAPVNAGAIAGGAVGGLVFIALIVAVTVLIVKRRRAVLKSDVPAQAYENEEVSNSAVAQAAPKNNEGEYEEIGIETQRVENKYPLYENGHLEGTPQGAKESAYSGLGPRGPSAPNVYDQLSAYENQVIVQ